MHLRVIVVGFKINSFEYNLVKLVFSNMVLSSVAPIVSFKSEYKQVILFKSLQDNPLLIPV